MITEKAAAFIEQLKATPPNKMLISAKALELVASLEQNAEVPIEVFQALDNQSRSAMLMAFVAMTMQALGAGV